MKRLTMDDLLIYSEEKATSKYFDQHNFKWFSRGLVLFFIISAWQLGVMRGDFEDHFFPAIGYGTTAVLSLVLFIFRHGRLVGASFYPFLLNYLFIQFLLLSVFREDWDSGSYAAYLFAYYLILFRLRFSAYFMLFGVIATHIALNTYLSDDRMWLYFGTALFNCLVCMIIAVMLTALRKRKFLAVWRIERNNKERLRMKEELDQARLIQLSLLPGDATNIAGFDISGSSIPATEVGGDYYDFFKLDEHRVMLVIGDVSGHGVASGLVLSGVRSCLYMLREDLPGPGALMGKLNRMLKQTTDRKMFMTFLVVVFDMNERTLTLASAGHPPMLHFRPAGASLEEVRQIALPLGGIMGAKYTEQTVSFESGDLFVFYTDGLIEARNAAGDEFGLKRLMRKIKPLAARTESAEKIREVLMTDAQLFIGEQIQEDDITLVVVKAKEKEIQKEMPVETVPESTQAEAAID